MSDKETAFVYSSSEVAQYYGMTIKGMEYYESRGLVHPERVGSGKIRRYSLLDSYRLFFARMFKNLGVGLPETLDILENNRLSHLEDAFQKQIITMRSALAIQQRMLEGLEHTRDLMAVIESGELPMKITEEDGFYRLFLRQFNGPHTSSDENTAEYRNWNDYLPITNASLRIPLADCLARRPQVDTQVGMIIKARDFHALGLKESERTEQIPAGRFLYTVIRAEWKDLGSGDWLHPALDYMETHNLRQTGDTFTRMIFVLRDEDGSESRYDEAWFPIEDRS